jgi:sortase (surface protein transpeptidase)
MARKLSIGLIIVGIATTWLAVYWQPTTVAHHAAPPPATVAHHAPWPSPRPLAAGLQVPVELQIPSISVDSIVEQVGMDKQGDMGVPRQLDDVAWYSPGVAPGQPGDAVIDGHKDNAYGSRGVFWSLGQLKVGDEIDVVMTNHSKLRFTVAQVRTVAYDAKPMTLGLFAAGGPARLTLISCTGQVNAQRTAYLQRLIVDATPT